MSESNSNRKKYQKVQKPLDEFQKLIDGIDLNALDLGIKKTMPTLNGEAREVVKEWYRNFLYLWCDRRSHRAYPDT